MIYVDDLMAIVEQFPLGTRLIEGKLLKSKKSER